jgi:type III secretory pathway component EscR
MSIPIRTEIPDVLWQQAQAFVQHGWAENMQELIAESLRRYLESHQEAMMEQFIMEDVEWGLHGEE